jgi:hypothetical protein
MSELGPRLASAHEAQVGLNPWFTITVPAKQWRRCSYRPYGRPGLFKALSSIYYGLDFWTREQRREKEESETHSTPPYTSRPVDPNRVGHSEPKAHRPRPADPNRVGHREPKVHYLGLRTPIGSGTVNRRSISTTRLHPERGVSDCLVSHDIYFYIGFVIFKFYWQIIYYLNVNIINDVLYILKYFRIKCLLEIYACKSKLAIRVCSFALEQIK